MTAADDRTVTVGLDPTRMVATCGHPDPLGYLAGTPCRPCADRGHRIALGQVTR